MVLDTTTLNILQDQAITAAKEAGDYIQSRFQKGFDKNHKDVGESRASQIVTEVDFKAQEVILKHLRESMAKYDLGLLTEELPDDGSRFEKDYFWCIDPLDGTLCFAEGRSGYAVSIALISKSGDPVLGVVNVPDQEEIYSCIKGQGLKLNGKAFSKEEKSPQVTLKLYFDYGMRKYPQFEGIMRKLEIWMAENAIEEYKFFNGKGAVCNAIEVLNAENACFCKLPKNREGGGSIWDYAATRLFFEEFNLQVSDAMRNSLNLNNAETSFMNKYGVIYASKPAISQLLLI